jgi:hypothetical protein
MGRLLGLWWLASRHLIALIVFVVDSNRRLLLVLLGCKRKTTDHVRSQVVVAVPPRHLTNMETKQSTIDNRGVARLMLQDEGEYETRST